MAEENNPDSPENIAQDFQVIVDEYVKQNYAAKV
jgi:hypothetical protein